MRDNFWPINKFDEKLRKEQYSLQKILYYWALMLQVFFFMVGFILATKPIWTGTRTMPFVIYTVIDYSNTPYFLSIYLLEIANVYLGVIVVPGYDGLFVDFVSRIYCQIRMLCRAFETLSLDNIKTKKEEEESFKKMKAYIKHHCLLLKYKTVIKSNLLYCLNI